MNLVRVAPPAIEPVSLDDAKAQLRVDGEFEDDLIAALIRTATVALDGRDGELGRCLITQTWTMTLDAFPSEIIVPLPPCQAVTEIAYIDIDDQTVVLDPSAYAVSGLGSSDPARIRPAVGADWPSLWSTPDAVSVSFRAGYGDAAADVPDTIRTAIKMHVASLFLQRESAWFGPGAVTKLPSHVADLVTNHKVWSF